MLNFFPFAFSGYSIAFREWNNSLYETQNDRTLYTFPECGPGSAPGANCWDDFYSNNYCKWGWLRTLQVFSNANMYALWFCSFAAFSWYTRND